MGMAMRLSIEVACLEPALIEEVVEVRSKAQVVRFPVTARVHEAREYDDLDAQALSVNGRRIREPAERKGRGGRELGTVELILTKIIAGACLVLRTKHCLGTEVMKVCRVRIGL